MLASWYWLFILSHIFKHLVPLFSVHFSSDGPVAAEIKYELRENY